MILNHIAYLAIYSNSFIQTEVHRFKLYPI